MNSADTVLLRIFCLWTQTSPSSNPNSPDVNFGHEQCEVLQVAELTSIIIFLSFTAAADEPRPQKRAVSPQPESRGRIGLYVGLTAAGLICLGLCFIGLCFTKCPNKTININAAV